jgi:hypothetical protein
MVWQAIPAEPVQLRFPFTDWQRNVSAEAAAPQSIDTRTNSVTRDLAATATDDRDMKATPKTVA